MTKQHKSQKYNTSYQLKLPVEISTIIEISDPVYTFCEVMDCIDLRKYLAVKESKTGRKRYNPLILLKVILFAFMEKGYVSLREIEKLCKTDIRFIRLNEELTEFHKEVLSNLNSVHGALLRMNRSIQAEGAFGTIKWNKSYQRIRRRGLKSVILEIAMISCGFYLHKYHLKSLARQLAA